VPTEFLDFQWRASVTGYAWIRERPSLSDDRFMDTEDVDFDLKLTMLEKLPIGTIDGMDDRGRVPLLVHDPMSANRRVYMPLRYETGLFMIFAATPPTLEGIVAFANQFGHLGKGAEVEFPATIATKAAEAVAEGIRGGLTIEEAFDRFPNAVLTYGEPLGTWKRQIREMADVVSLWQLVQRQDVPGLAQRIRREAGVVRHVPAGADDAAEGTVIASLKESPELFRQFERDLFGPALAYIARVITERLSGLVSLETRWPGQGRTLPTYLMPDSLLGALWLQCALAVNGDKTYVTCEECGRPFEVSSKAARKSRRYCKDSCRVQAHRKRQADLKEQAATLCAAGKSARAIAKDLGVEVNKVKQWIAADSSKEK